MMQVSCLALGTTYGFHRLRISHGAFQAASLAFENNFAFLFHTFHFFTVVAGLVTFRVIVVSPTGVHVGHGVLVPMLYRVSFGIFPTLLKHRAVPVFSPQ